jgi:hypothetical protein
MVHRGISAHIGAHGEPPLGLMYHQEMAFAKAGGLSNYEVGHVILVSHYVLVSMLLVLRSSVQLPPTRPRRSAWNSPLA